MTNSKQVKLTLKIQGNRWQLRGLLEMAHFCRIWIHNFGLTAKSLYEALKGSGVEPLIWTK